jgi:hypothetical protein
MALAPLLAGVRYGSCFGVACAVAQVAMVSAAAHWYGALDAPTGQPILGWLLAGLIPGQFCDAWRRRLHQLAARACDATQRLDALARAYHVTRASHDQLQREIPGSPSSLRDALEALARDIKDVKCFIRAMKSVIARHPEARGCIIGPTSEDPGYARECAQLAAAIGLYGRPTFTGYRPAEEVLPELGLLVLASISEGLPLVVLEAFASGLPVLTTDVGACRELVEGRTPDDCEQGAAGAVVPFADPDAVAHAALALLGDPARWRAAQQAAIRRVETHCTEARVFNACRRIYQEHTHGRRRSSAQL